MTGTVASSFQDPGAGTLAGGDASPGVCAVAQFSGGGGGEFPHCSVVAWCCGGVYLVLEYM
jgi:hypothetical protein